MNEPIGRYAGEPVFRLADAHEQHRPLLYDTAAMARRARYDDLPPDTRPLAHALPIEWAGKRWWGLAINWRGRTIWRSTHDAWFATENYAEFKARTGQDDVVESPDLRPR